MFGGDCSRSLLPIPVLFKPKYDDLVQELHGAKEHIRSLDSKCEVLQFEKLTQTVCFNIMREEYAALQKRHNELSEKYNRQQVEADLRGEEEAPKEIAKVADALRSRTSRRSRRSRQRFDRWQAKQRDTDSWRADALADSPEGRDDGVTDDERASDDRQAEEEPCPGELCAASEECMEDAWPPPGADESKAETPGAADDLRALHDAALRDFIADVRSYPRNS